MFTRRCFAHALCGVLLLAVSADAATVRGSVSDISGGLLPGAHVVLRGVATGQELSVETSNDGRFQFEIAALGTYLANLGDDQARQRHAGDPSLR